MESRDKSWYVKRAVTRKIIREGTGLRPGRMTLPACWERAEGHALLICTKVMETNIADPELARACIELMLLLDEIKMRGVQYQLPI